MRQSDTVARLGGDEFVIDGAAVAPFRYRMLRCATNDELRHALKMIRRNPLVKTSRLHSPSAVAIDLADTFATRRQRAGALLICATLISVGALAALFGLKPGPEMKPFLPMTATMWALAELFTAFLFLAQFYANGRAAFAILSMAYAFNSWLTWPYVVAFPGLYWTGPLTPGEQQISIVLWAIWHATFPLLAIYAIAIDSPLSRIVSRTKLRVVSIVVIALPLMAASLISLLVFQYRDFVPHLVLNGHFQPLWKSFFTPFTVAVNLFACVIIIGRRRLTTVALWLSVAMFAATIDAIINYMSPVRYSLAWDVGKLITVFTASVVLIMMLFDIAGLYERITRLARIDVLTSLPNRRAYAEHVQLLLHNARRMKSSMAILMIDIDFFKRYNDSHGHLAGDECLRGVAAALASCATRPLDLVARYGGEEFVALLPDTPLPGAVVIAERMRSVVENLQGVVVKQSGAVTVTISVGVGFIENVGSIDDTALLAVADSALYEAKATGRNRVVARSVLPEDPDSAGPPSLRLADAVL